MPSLETKVERRQRMEDNANKRGPFRKRMSNNRKGQPQRNHTVQALDSAHSRRMEKLQLS